MEELYQRMDDWVDRLSDGTYQPDGLEAIFVGIFASEPNYQLYVVGSNEYDPEDDEWTCNEDWGVGLPYLDTGIPVVSRTWDMVLEAVIHTLEVLVEKKRDTFLQWDLVVATGFDDGDITIVKED